MALAYQAILDEIAHEIKPYLNEGNVANYIPELANVMPTHFCDVAHVRGWEKFSCGRLRKAFFDSKYFQAFYPRYGNETRR